MLAFQNRKLRMLQGVGVVALFLAFLALMALPPLLSETPGTEGPEVNVPAMQNVPSPNAPPVLLETE
jgi:hypothetical protein